MFYTASVHEKMSKKSDADMYIYMYMYILKVFVHVYVHVRHERDKRARREWTQHTTYKRARNMTLLCLPGHAGHFSK